MSLQQRLSCVHCHDCHGGGQWINRNCDDEDPIGPPTTPGPIFPVAAQSVNLNDTATLVDPSWQNWQCFTLTFNLNGRDSTSRGCIPAQGSQDATCSSINPAARVIWCDLCERDNCNSSSYIYASTLMLIASFLLLVKM